MTGIQKMNKPIILLLTLFCLNMAYCSLFKITSDDVNNKERFTKQPKSLLSSNSADACSLSEASTKISVSEFQKLSGTDLTITPFHTAIFSAIPASSSIIHARFFKPGRHHSVSSIPLFIKNRALII